MKPIEMHPTCCPISGEKGDWSVRHFRVTDFSLFYANPMLSGVGLLFLPIGYFSESIVARSDYIRRQTVLSRAKYFRHFDWVLPAARARNKHRWVCAALAIA